MGLLLMTAGCGSLRQMAATFCKSDHADPEIASLMQSSCEGNHRSSLSLGLRYEKGQGVPLDPARARQYYKRAATPRSGTTYIYVPAAGKVAGYTMPINTGPDLPGLAEAQYRLALMYQRGLGGKRNQRKARKWLERAARQGHPAASAMLAELETLNDS